MFSILKNIEIELLEDDESKSMTKEQICNYYKLSQHCTFDYAIPREFIKDITEKLNLEHADGFVWIYDHLGHIFGRPFPLTKFWEKKLREYINLKSTTLPHENKD